MINIVVFTGAGMSAESGISTFRDTGGLWERYKIEDVATPEAWNKDPKKVLFFYNLRRKQLAQVVPNKGHLALAELEKKYHVQIITQNVDNLHERAGSTKVLHLHGELMKMRSTSRNQEVYDVSDEKLEYSLGDKCSQGFQLRPHIVWFGEDVPEMGKAIILTEQADILIIIGTSLQVYPAANLVYNVKDGTPIYLIDPNEIDFLPSNVKVIKKGGSEGLIELIDNYLD